MITPFKEMGLKTISPWDIGGGDDHSFRNAHIPTFTFMQDPIDYETRTHHSNADLFGRLIPEDIQFNTAVLAALAWQTARRDEKFPR
jgi:carboxypeptidase Q